MGMLITATILDSYDWYINAPQSWKAQAKSDFIDCVNRAKRFRPTPEQQRGMDFEKLICANRDKDVDTFVQIVSACYYRNHTKEEVKNAVQIALDMREAIGDGEFQKQLSMDIKREALNETWTLFGYADVFVPGQGIMDIKTCTHYKDDRKYLDKNQHHVYRMCSGLQGFYYLVADFDGTDIPRYLHVLDATGNVDYSRDKVLGTIDRMKDWLHTNDMWYNYITHFCRGRV